jgi:hypothetical protein
MNKEYKVKLNLEKEGDAYLLVTHNGHQWASIRIHDLVTEIPLIISELQRYLKSVIKED